MTRVFQVGLGEQDGHSLLDLLRYDPLTQEVVHHVKDACGPLGLLRERPQQLMCDGVRPCGFSSFPCCRSLVTCFQAVRASCAGAARAACRACLSSVLSLYLSLALPGTVRCFAMSLTAWCVSVCCSGALAAACGSAPSGWRGPLCAMSTHSRSWPRPLAIWVCKHLVGIDPCQHTRFGEGAPPCQQVLFCLCGGGVVRYVSTKRGC